MVSRIFAPATSITTSWPTSATRRSSPRRWIPFGERRPGHPLGRRQAARRRELAEVPVGLPAERVDRARADVGDVERPRGAVPGGALGVLEAAHRAAGVGLGRQTGGHQPDAAASGDNDQAAHDTLPSPRARPGSLTRPAVPSHPVDRFGAVEVAGLACSMCCSRPAASAAGRRRRRSAPTAWRARPAGTADGAPRRRQSTGGWRPSPTKGRCGRPWPG